MPERLTAADVYRVLLGLVAIPLGIIILYRSVSSGSLSVPAMLVGVAFVGFGVYRTWLAWQRYQMFRKLQDREL